MENYFEENITSDFKDKVINRSVNGIYVYDLAKGTNIYINDRYTQLTGYTLEDLNAKSNEEFFQLFHPDEHAAISQHMNDVLASEVEEVIEIEYRFKKADGLWMWCFSRDAVFDRDTEGSPTQFMGTFVDITKTQNL